MELDHLLHKVQGVLKNEQRNVGDLNKINKENEPNTTKVVDSLKKVVGEAVFNSKTKQKLYNLLFLNTDLDVCKNLKTNRKYAHLVGFFPKLSRDLFMKVVVGLKLDQYLYESVQHFPSFLSYQVLEMTLKSLSWLDLFESVAFVENVLVALFKKITVMEEEDKYNIPLKEAFHTLLLHYDAEKGGCIKRMSQWKNSKIKHYGGLVMASMLSLLERCSKIYLKEDDITNPDDIVLYEFTFEEEVVKADTTNSSENKSISVQNCYEHVVAKCLENNCSITIDIWMFWVEINLDDTPGTDNTLQRLIGERAYTCCEVLQKILCLGVSSKEVSELIIRLKSIALEPRTEEEMASKLDLVEVLNNVNDPSKDSRKWLKLLVNNASYVIEPDSLETLKSHMNSLQSPDMMVLWKNLFEYIKSSNNSRVQKDFIVEIAKSLDFDYQVQLLQYFLENFGLSDILKREDFQEVFVESFNKVINIDDKEKEVYSQFLSLALQSAEEVVCKAVTEGISSEVRGHLMADILGRLQPMCDACLGPDPLLVVALDRLLLTLPDLPESHRTNYPLFVRELVMRESLNGETFIKLCLMSKMHLHLKSKNCIVINVCLETLSELFDINCIHNCPACIFMLIQVVEAIRWSPPTYDTDSMHVCETALLLIDQFISKWFESGFEEIQRKNLSSLLEKCISPLNRYNLARVLPDEPLPTDVALRYIYRMHFGIGEWSIVRTNDQERLRVVYGLCYLLPVLTSKEWQDLFCVVTPTCAEFMYLFHIVTDSILLCLDSTKANPDPNVLSCLSFTIFNLSAVVQCEARRWNSNDNEYRISVLSKMCQLVSALPLSQQEFLGLVLVKVMQLLLPSSSRRRPLTDEETASTTTSIAMIQHDNVRQSLAQEFLEMMDR